LQGRRPVVLDRRAGDRPRRLAAAGARAPGRGAVLSPFSPNRGRPQADPNGEDQPSAEGRHTALPHVMGTLCRPSADDHARTVGRLRRPLRAKRLYAVALSSRRTRSASVFSSVAVIAGSCLISFVKALRATRIVSTSVTAETPAERGAPSSSAISPK